MMNEAESSSTMDRRSWVKNVIGGAVATGIVANKVAVEGPSPYHPATGSLVGKTVIITGGNTGLGLETAKRLAVAGATIVITSRSTAKGEAAIRTIQDYIAGENVSNSNLYTLPLDLCDLSSVKAFPALLQQNPAISKIDVLLNNAGVMAIPDKQITKDGFEKTFQTNHLGHFALTALLMPFMKENGTVINVASAAYLIANKGLNLDNLNSEQSYGPWESYGQSKLENILFTKELQRRAGDKITAVSLHPGAVRTDLARFIIGEEKFAAMQASNKFSPVDALTLLPGLYFTKGVDRGANTQIWLASGEGGNDIGGKFFQNLQEQTLQPCAMDMEKARELWTVSEKLTGVTFNV
jgi:NAD(P)-dependent dehydrogenase (short-subunit alcohol dehydrogenase family)